MRQQSKEQLFRSVAQGELPFVLSSEKPRSIALQAYSLFSCSNRKSPASHLASR